jgi:hypothetical protein
MARTRYVRRGAFLAIDPQNGRFKIGETVAWQAGKGKARHIGRVIAVVGAHEYPVNVNRVAYFDPPIPTFRGFWRDHESYVVEDAEGKRWWPRVGNLVLAAET